MALMTKYPDFVSFAKSYDPQKLMKVRDDKLAILDESHPLLLVLGKAYGNNSVIIWLMQVISVFNEYSGKREKMDDWQIESLARNIAKDFGWLKVSEIMLFFNKYANGCYGPIYAAIDPTDIMANFREKFLSWRARVVSKAEEEAQWEERDRWKREALKPEQIKALKERLSNINKSLKQ